MGVMAPPPTPSTVMKGSGGAFSGGAGGFSGGAAWAAGGWSCGAACSAYSTASTRGTRRSTAATAKRQGIRNATSLHTPILLDCRPVLNAQSENRFAGAETHETYSKTNQTQYSSGLLSPVPDRSSSIRSARVVVSYTCSIARSARSHMPIKAQRPFKGQCCVPFPSPHLTGANEPSTDRMMSPTVIDSGETVSTYPPWIPRRDSTSPEFFNPWRINSRNRGGIA